MASSAAAGASTSSALTPTEKNENKPVKKICGISQQSLVKLALLLTLVAGLVVGVTVGDLDGRIGDLFEWVDDNKVPGAFIFVSVYALVTSAPPAPPI